MTPKEMLHEIAENWFLQEPAFYSLLCLQQEVENPHIECPIRCGEGRIEYNPLLLARKNYKETELLLRIEMIRLFLKHPYERRPEGCSGETIALGSDCTIADGYCLLKEAGALKGPGYYHLPMGECYEWYCKQIENQKEKEPDRDSSDNASNTSNRQKSELWHDDSLMQIRINELIERTTDWGSLSGDIVERIQASTRARLNRSMPFGSYTFHWSAITQNDGADATVRVRHWLCFSEGCELKADIRPGDGKVSYDFNVAGDGNKPSLDGYTDLDFAQPVEITYKFDPSGASHCHVTYYVNGVESGSFDTSETMLRTVTWGASINMYIGVDNENSGSAVLEWYEYTAPMNWE